MAQCDDQEILILQADTMVHVAGSRRFTTHNNLNFPPPRASLVRLVLHLIGKPRKQTLLRVCPHHHPAPKRTWIVAATIVNSKSDATRCSWWKSYGQSGRDRDFSVPSMWTRRLFRSQRQATSSAFWTAQYRTESTCTAGPARIRPHHVRGGACSSSAGCFARTTRRGS